MSKGEEQIVQILKAGGLKFEREKTYPDLRGGRFRFDFFVEGKGLVEIDGSQHFSFVKVFYKSQGDWNKAREHDRRKNSYALAHDIPLWRIPYWDLSTLRDCKDLFQDKYRVKTRYHNDIIKPPERK